MRRHVGTGRELCKCDDSECSLIESNKTLEANASKCLTSRDLSARSLVAPAHDHLLVCRPTVVTV